VGKRGKGSTIKLNKRMKCDQERFKFLTTIVAAFHMVLDQRHRLGSIFSRQRRFHETVQFAEAFVADNLVEACGYNLLHQLPQLLRLKLGYLVGADGDNRTHYLSQHIILGPLQLSSLVGFFSLLARCFKG
jgi:hypothetical protein